jgi:hypothetical protein
MQNKQPNRSAAEPKAWWQGALAGEQLPNLVFRRPQMRQLRFPWLRVMRALDWSAEDLFGLAPVPEKD